MAAALSLSPRLDPSTWYWWNSTLETLLLATRQSDMTCKRWNTVLNRTHGIVYEPVHLAELPDSAGAATGVVFRSSGAVCGQERDSVTRLRLPVKFATLTLRPSIFVVVHTEVVTHAVEPKAIAAQTPQLQIVRKRQLTNKMIIITVKLLDLCPGGFQGRWGPASAGWRHLATSWRNPKRGKADWIELVEWLKWFYGQVYILHENRFHAIDGPDWGRRRQSVEPELYLVVVGIILQQRRDLLLSEAEEGKWYGFGGFHTRVEIGQSCCFLGIVQLDCFYSGRLKRCQIDRIHGDLDLCCKWLFHPSDRIYCCSLWFTSPIRWNTHSLYCWEWQLEIDCGWKLDNLK